MAMIHGKSPVRKCSNDETNDDWLNSPICEEHLNCACSQGQSEKRTSDASLMRKLKLLQSDFYFNLRLLAERNYELDQLELQLKECSSILSQKNAEISALVAHVDCLKQKLGRLEDEKAFESQCSKELIKLDDSEINDSIRKLGTMENGIQQKEDDDEMRIKKRITSFYKDRLHQVEEKYKNDIEEIQRDHDKEIELKSLELITKESELAEVKKENERIKHQISFLKEELLCQQNSTKLVQFNQESMAKFLKDELLARDAQLKNEFSEIQKRYETLLRNPCSSCLSLKNQVKSLQGQMMELLLAKPKKDKDEDTHLLKEVKEKLDESTKNAQKLREQNLTLKKAITAMRVAAEDSLTVKVGINGQPQTLSTAKVNLDHSKCGEMQRSQNPNPAVKSNDCQMDANVSQTASVPLHTTKSVNSASQHLTRCSNDMSHLKQKQKTLKAEAKDLLDTLSINSKNSMCHQQTTQCNETTIKKKMGDNTKNACSQGIKEIEKNMQNMDFPIKRDTGIQPQPRFEKMLQQVEFLVENLREGMIGNLHSQLNHRMVPVFNISLDERPMAAECRDSSRSPNEFCAQEVERTAKKTNIRTSAGVTCSLGSHVNSLLNDENEYTCDSGSIKRKNLKIVLPVMDQQMMFTPRDTLTVNCEE